MDPFVLPPSTLETNIVEAVEAVPVDSAAVEAVVLGSITTAAAAAAVLPPASMEAVALGSIATAAAAAAVLPAVEIVLGAVVNQLEIQQKLDDVNIVHPTENNCLQTTETDNRVSIYPRQSANATSFENSLFHLNSDFVQEQEALEKDLEENDVIVLSSNNDLRIDSVAVCGLTIIKEREDVEETPVKVLVDDLEVKDVRSVEHTLCRLKQENASEEQPFQAILRDHHVSISSRNNDEKALEDILNQLNKLMSACTSSPNPDRGRSPGFWTIHQQDSSKGGPWVHSKKIFPMYEIMPWYSLMDKNSELPLPSPLSAKRIYEDIQHVMLLRLRYLSSTMGQAYTNLLDEGEKKIEDYRRHGMDEMIEDWDCTCITTWWKGKNVAHQLVNQVMEQAMVDEASQYLMRYSDLNQTRTDHVTSSPQLAPYNYCSSPLQMLSNRDDYMSVLVRALLAAQHSVIISTCYLFYQDPAQIYILKEILPLISRRKEGRNAVKVSFLMDLFVFESNILSSPFQVMRDTEDGKEKLAQTNTTTSTDSQEDSPQVTDSSFFRYLPAYAPSSDHEQRPFKSKYDLFEFLRQLSNSADNTFDLRFWCARDRRSGYRIKNHSKGIVVDDQWAIFGGSNLTPNMLASKSDLDCVVVGEAAKSVGRTLWKLWQALDDPVDMKNNSMKTTAAVPPLHNAALPSPENKDISLHTSNTTYDIFTNSRMLILSSTPNSIDQPDAILSAVIRQIDNARGSILVSMGHCNIPSSFVDALARASDRGVKNLQILVNSYHSCDLRGGQRDLFFSVRYLLQRVPSVQVYATYNNDELGVPFLHGKYVVVDSSWVALGSWNLWKRAEVYEIELEALIESFEVAAFLRDKFNRDRDKHAVSVTLSDCFPGNRFCPSGCSLCRHFGPFFQMDTL